MRFEPHEEERYGIKNGDLIVCEGGEPGRCAIWRSEVPIMKIQKALHRVRVNPGFNNEFLYYRLLLAGRNGELEKYFIGSTIKHLTGVNLKKIEFDFPPYEMQCAISKVLANLDSKIRLNNRINAELEAMAKTIYDYWFVQFDFPNKNGKPYKASAGKMVWSKELKREIPEGWLGCKLGDVVESTGTGLNPRDNFVLGEGNNFYVTIKNIKQGRVILDDRCDKISDEALKIINNRSDLRVGDILYTSIEPVGITYLLREVPTNWNINESVFTIRPDYGKVTSEFLYMFLSGDYIKSYTKNVSAGSIHKGVRHGTLKECKFILPQKGTINEFTRIVKPILNKEDLIQKENQKLTELRDWLLPMLMNGQIKIKDAEQELAMAAEPRIKYKGN
ncbi:MAG: restriction endonuclease subunit S [Cyclobacteriaceae bacterium]|jgi:type I restriction enzyme S subunit